MFIVVGTTVLVIDRNMTIAASFGQSITVFYQKVSGLNRNITAIQCNTGCINCPGKGAGIADVDFSIGKFFSKFMCLGDAGAVSMAMCIRTVLPE